MPLRTVTLRVVSAEGRRWLMAHSWRGTATPAQEVERLNRLAAEQDLGLEFELA
jgi:hypothetical protein